MTVGHSGHRHFGLGHFGLVVSATENAKAECFGHNHKLWVEDGSIHVCMRDTLLRFNSICSRVLVLSSCNVRVCKQKLVFLFLNKNICLGCSEEQSHLWVLNRTI